MPTPSVRTTTHSYPKDEVDAMELFYGGKKCVITNLSRNIEWAHMLDAALDISNPRLSSMLRCNLRTDRYPRHAAEVRENLVPINIDHHQSMDLRLAQSTLFLHEDIIVRTLLYERQLQKWRIEEVKAGRGDPGRPSYDTVFGGMPNTPHRYHVVEEFRSFLRFDANDIDDDTGVRYRSINCPGIHDSRSQQDFPIIPTLLSIPFSLLHTIPRLSSMFPISPYQQKLIQLGSEIIKLWWWNPLPKMIADSEKIAVGKKRKHQSDQRDPGPKPIASITTTFSEFLGLQTTTTSTAQSSKCTLQDVKLPTPFGTIPLVSLDRDELLFTSADEKSAKLTRSFNTNKDLVITSRVSSASGETAEGDEDLGETNNIDGFDVISWSENVANCGSELLPPLIPSPFHRGVLGGPSVNDILMIKGLIHPLVYLDFLDLSSFTLP